MKTTKYTRNLATVLRLSEPNNNKVPFLFNGLSFHKLLKTAAPKIAERSSKMREAINLSEFIHYATFENTFEDLSLLFGHVYSSPDGRQPNVVLEGPQNIQYFRNCTIKLKLRLTDTNYSSALQY